MSLSLDTSCRICLGGNANHNIYFTKRSHNSTKVACDEMIIEVLSLAVSHDDGLPEKICRKCFSKLSSAYKFKKLAEISYKTLAKHFIKQTGEEEHIQVIKKEIKLEFDVKDEDSDTSGSTKAREENDCAASPSPPRSIPAPAGGKPEDNSLVEKFPVDEAVESPLFIGNNEGMKLEHSDRDEDFQPELKKSIKRKKPSIKHKSNKSVEVFGIAKRPGRPPRRGAREGKRKGKERGTATVCPLCGKQVVDMDTHSETHKPSSEKRRLPCPDCPKLFVSQSSRRRHVLVHHLGRLYHCQICDKSYKHGDQHIRMVHSAQPKPLCCPLCERRFFTKAQLNIHLTSHTKERSFLCSVCGKGFRTHTDSEIHRRSVHEKERNVMCQYCPKGFFSNADLRKHLCTHTNERKYKCKECDKSFYRSTQLKIHLQRHAGIKNVHCNLCEKAFYTLSNLKIHMISHTKEKNFPCKYCGVKFGRSHHRDRHHKTAHENKLDKSCQESSTRQTQQPSAPVLLQE